MTSTPRLIEELASRGMPVRPIASPLQRTLGWLAFATAVIAAVAAAYGLRPDLGIALSSTAGATEFAASIATGVAAAFATFQVSVPGRSPRWAWLPLPFLLAWVGGLTLGCFEEFARIGPAALAMHAEVRECGLAITLVSVPLAIGMLLMVRHAGVVRPAASALLAMLSAASLAAAGVSLFHGGESALMTLVWHFGVVAVLSLLCLVLGRPLFAWIGYARG